MKKTLLVALTALLILTGCSGKSNLMSGYKGFDKKDNHFIRENYTDAMTKIENKEAGIFYFGFDTCPWCVALVPVLEDALTEADVKAEYIDVQDKEFKEDKELQDRFTKFNASLPQDQTSMQNGAPTVPFVVIIDKDGNLSTHVGTIDNKQQLSDTEKEFLKLRLADKFKKVK
ncbi:MAG: glutaredoxin domain-containing protein [Erysipelothrix sp.]